METAQFPGTTSRTEQRPGRRNFFKEAAALVLGALAIVPPIASGIMVLVDPLRRKTGQSFLLPVTSLRSLPEDGLPRKFAVVSSHTDAWNRNPSVPIGAVYLRRTGPKSVEAFNVVCPHAGCSVDYVTGRKAYICPCHNSVFNLQGQISDPKSPSPRGLDRLEVEIRNDDEVWVKFQNYLAGHKQRIPVA